MPTTSSKKQYLTTYLGLIKKAKSEDPKEIAEYIKGLDIKDTSKLAYLNSIISLKKFDSSAIKENIDSIREYRDSLGLSVDKARANTNVNANQAKALDKVSYSNLKEFVSKLDAEKEESDKNLENYVLVKLMTEYPVRNDLQEISLTKVKKDLESGVNALYIPTAGKDRRAILSIVEYKTSKSYGDIKITLDMDLTNDIKNLIKDGRKYLFVNTKGEALSSSSFTHKLNRIFMKEFGVPISSTIIRKIYLTGKYGKISDEMEKDSKIMGHSVDTAREFYIDKRDGVRNTGKAEE